MAPGTVGPEGVFSSLWEEFQGAPWLRQESAKRMKLQGRERENEFYVQAYSCGDQTKMLSHSSMAHLIPVLLGLLVSELRSSPSKRWG